MVTPSKRELETELEDLDVGESDRDPVTVTWREADPAARLDGMTYDADSRTLTYDLWDAQRECLDALTNDDQDVVAFLAGYGTGKSILGARWLLAQALAHPDSRFLAMGQDFQKARGGTFRVLFEQLPGDGTSQASDGPEQSPLVADYSRQAHALTLTNGTVIRLESGTEWHRCAGDEFGGIWLDEPSHYEADLHDLLEMLGGRLRGVSGPKVQCWTLTGNGYNDAWEILAQHQDATGEPLGLDIELVRASTLDNPYHEDDDIERFKRQYVGTERAEQALHGGFAAAQGLVYAGFQRDEHVIPHAEACECVVEGEWIYGYDAGWRDPRILLEIGRTDYDQFVVVDMFHESKSYIEDVIAWLKRNGKPDGPIYAEHKPDEIRTFRREGYHVIKAKKSLDAGIPTVRQRLETDDTGRAGLLVSDRCDALIREFLGYKEEHVGASQAEDHCLDALRYALHTERVRGRGGAWGDQRSEPGPSETGPIVIKSGTEGARRRDQYHNRR